MAPAGEGDPWLPDLCRLPRLAMLFATAELVVLVVALAPESSLSVEDGRRVEHIVLEHVDFAGEPVSAAEAERLREARRAARDQGPDDADASAATARGAVRAAARDDAP